MDRLSALLSVIAVISMLAGHFGGIEWLFWGGMILLSNFWVLFVFIYYRVRRPKSPGPNSGVDQGRDNSVGGTSD